MYSFFIQSYSNYKGLFYWLNWPGYISNVVLRPMVMVLTYALLGRFALNPEAARNFALGIGVFSMVFILVGGIAQSYAYDRSQGTIAFVFLSPVNRLVNYLSRMIIHLPNALIVFFFGLAAAWLLAGIDFGLVNWGGFIISIVITAASIAAFGQAIGVVAIALRNWLNTFGLILGIVMALTGIIVPLSVYPPFIQEFCKILPMTNGLTAAKLAFAGASFTSLWSLVLREALTGLVYLFLGYCGFWLFERVVKHTGALDAETMS